MAHKKAPLTLALIQGQARLIFEYPQDKKNNQT